MKRRKKWMSFLLTVAMVICYMPVTAFASDFVDMPKDWSTEAIAAAVDNGLLKGYETAQGMEIRPQANITRAEFASVINRAFGAQKKESLTGVIDVAANAWYATELAKAVHMGTMKQDSLMRPNAPITRQEAAVMLTRAFKLTNSDAKNTALDAFADKQKIATWAAEDLCTLVQKGYMAGANGKLDPQGNMTRAELAKIMDNLVKQYITQPGTVTELVASGNVIINTPNVTLENVSINGSLIIGDGVGDGDIKLNNVKVTGETVLRGGGLNSFIVTGNSVLGTIVVAKVDGNLRVAVDGSSKVEVVEVKDGKDDVVVQGNFTSLAISAPSVPVVLQNARVTEITINTANSNLTVGAESAITSLKISEQAQNSALSVAGSITGITNDASSVIITADKGSTITGIITNGEKTVIQGEGKVVGVTVNGNNTQVNTNSTQTTVAKDVTGTTSGKTELAAGSSTKTDKDTASQVPTVKPGDSIKPPATETPVTPPSGGGGGGGGNSGGTVTTVETVSNIQVSQVHDDDIWYLTYTKPATADGIKEYKISYSTDGGLHWTKTMSVDAADPGSRIAALAGMTEESTTYTAVKVESVSSSGKYASSSTEAAINLSFTVQNSLMPLRVSKKTGIDEAEKWTRLTFHSTEIKENSEYYIEVTGADGSNPIPFPEKAQRAGAMVIQFPDWVASIPENARASMGELKGTYSTGFEITSKQRVAVEEPFTVLLKPSSLGTATDGAIQDLTEGKFYKVKMGFAGVEEQYVTSQGALTGDSAQAEALGSGITEITGLENDEMYEVIETEVLLKGAPCTTGYAYRFAME